MSLLNLGGSALSNLGGISQTASKLGSAISTAVNNPSNLLSAVRSMNLPAAGEVIGDVFSAIAVFNGDQNPNDWRVRLSVPYWPSFMTSPVFSPLMDAGGLVFPYTPQIQINSSAKYSTLDTTHSNFNIHSFKNSDPGTIVVSAPMNVEDSDQALYWIAALHFLRSLTKMFSGYDPKAGNPPPIVFLNGYGNYVLKNVPVVVTSFSTTLESQCDYISCDVVGSLAGQVSGAVDGLSSVSSALGGLAPQTLGGITSTANSILGGVGQVAALAGTFNLGGKVSGGVAHVPTKSTFNLTLQPVYSKSTARSFSLDRFVSGGYLNSSTGFV